MIAGRHAVVLGGSMGGLLAARVLADHFERVTLVERDRFPVEVVQRKGVPQGRHAHGLMAGGCRVLERLFPGFYAELVARGAIAGDVGETIRYWVAGVPLVGLQSGLRSLLMSRPLLETHVRERVLALKNVRAKDDCDVLGVLGSAERISGVWFARAAGSDSRSESRPISWWTRAGVDRAPRCGSASSGCPRRKRSTCASTSATPAVCIDASPSTSQVDTA